MSKQEQSLLKISPQNELKFEGPFNLATPSWITLTNISEKNVYFKLKTTAPKRYCVRPNSGFLRPKCVIEVQVLLQPFIYNPAEKNKHKFMVQSLVDPEGGTTTSPEELWRCVDPDKIMNHKLKCVFELPSLRGNEQEVLAEAAVQGEEKPKKVIDNKSAPKGVVEGTEKAPMEINKQQEEELKLRRENLLLKETVAQLRSDLEGQISCHSYSPPASTPGELSPMMIYIAIAVIVGITSFILGKCVV